MVLFICVVGLSSDRIMTILQNEQIDLISIYPHYLIFYNGDLRLKYLQGTDEIIAVEPTKRLSIGGEVESLETVLATVKELLLLPATDHSVLRLEFAHSLRNWKISQILENITRAIKGYTRK